MWPKECRYLPESFGNRTGFDKIRADSGRICVKFGQVDKVRPSFADFGQIWAVFDTCWDTFVQLRPDFAQGRPNVAGINQKLNRCRPNLTGADQI